MLNAPFQAQFTVTSPEASAVNGPAHCPTWVVSIIVNVVLSPGAKPLKAIVTPVVRICETVRCAVGGVGDGAGTTCTAAEAVSPAVASVTTNVCVPTAPPLVPGISALPNGVVMEPLESVVLFGNQPVTSAPSIVTVSGSFGPNPVAEVMPTHP